MTLSVSGEARPAETTAEDLDVVSDNNSSPTLMSINGQIQLRTDRAVLQPGPGRAGRPSTPLNSDPMCFANRPEVAVFDGRFVIAWQFSCESGKWNTVLQGARSVALGESVSRQ